jgi:3-oxoacyl-[acyl-carrier-protein] synthase II
VRKFDATDLPVRIGGEIEFGDGELGLPSDRLAEMPTTAKWSVLSARKAVQDAGLNLAAEDPYAIDVIAGVSISSLDSLEPRFLERGGAGMAEGTPQAAFLMNPAAAAIQIGRDLDLHGEVVNITTACSSSASAIGYAARLIRHGESECVLAGGADESVCPFFLGLLGNGCLSRRNDDPLHASRPFDRQRDGYVLSDAACFLVLEEYKRAAQRGAIPYCELTGFGSTSDASSAFKLGKSEEPGARAIEKALSNAGRSADDVDYYCALGVAGKWTDVRETHMLKRVFRERAKRVPVSSLKSMMGHPNGASGAVQAAACALVIRHGAIPPTINYDEPDPECDLDYVPNQARQAHVRNAVAYCLGNGNNSALVLSAC